jgi:hypothetical protein
MSLRERIVDVRLPAQAEYATLAALVVQDAATRAQLHDEQRTQLSQATQLAFELIVRDALAGEREAIHVRTAWTPAQLRVSLT